MATKGEVPVTDGDWILTHEDGQRTMMKNESFVAEYEPIATKEAP